MKSNKNCIENDALKETQTFASSNNKRFAILDSLMNDYNYDVSQISLNQNKQEEDHFEQPDIVVYRSDNGKKPLIVVESRISDKNKAKLASENFAKEIKADFFAWLDCNNLVISQLSKYSGEYTKVDSFPYWVGCKPIKKLVAKKYHLPSFNDEHQLRSIIAYCHTRIYEKTGHDPSRAFDELLKILFLKIYDEKESNSFYNFVILQEETPHKNALRIRNFFETAVTDQKYIDIFKQRFNSHNIPSIELDDFTLNEIVLSLQGYGLLTTTETIAGSDIKGRVYEQMVGRTFRGELGQYFTPRTIAEFMVNLIDPKEGDRILDPACGTGGFLVMSIMHIKNKLGGKNNFHSSVFGVDINDRVCLAARINMIMHGNLPGNIINSDGLLLGDDFEANPVLSEIRYNSFNAIFSNPPFAGFEKDSKILAKFELGSNEKNQRKSITKEVLFIEKIFKLLDYGGKAALVLPMGIFNNPSLKFVRQYLFKKTKILAIVGLPGYAFTHTGTSVKGALLFFEKVRKPKVNCDVFVCEANNIGYDSTGRETTLNDFNEIINNYRKSNPDYLVKESELEYRFDPAYYNNNYSKLIEKISNSKYPLKRMIDLIDFRNEHFNPRDQTDEIFKYLETNCVDFSNGKILKIKKFKSNKVPSRAKLIARAGDFLIPTARESFKGVARLPRKLDGIVVTNRLFVVFPKQGINPTYLSLLFENEYIRALIKREATGEIAVSISKQAFERIKVPVPTLDEQKRIVSLITKKRGKVKELEKIINEIRRDVDGIVEKELF